MRPTALLVGIALSAIALLALPSASALHIDDGGVNAYTCDMSAHTDGGRLRNIGIMAHVDAGKTTTTERILYYSGIIHRIGSVDEGSATMDWMEQEQNRGITITSAATRLRWHDMDINLIDTPGHVDFTVEVERCLRVLDGAIAIFDAVHGVEPQSETVWRQADHYRMARLIYINKMDRAGADFDAACADIGAKLRARVVPLMIPVGSGSNLQGCIDLLARKYMVWNSEDAGSSWEAREVPADMRIEVERRRDYIFTTLGDFSDDVAEEYVEHGDVSVDIAHREIRRLVIAQEIFPVFCGASLRNIGIQPLLDGVARYIPAPHELPPVELHSADRSKKISRPRNEREGLAALIFKINHDRESGDLAFVRLYCGALRAGDRVYNATKGRYERILRLLRAHADDTSAVRELRAGDIGVIGGLKYSQTGDTLTADKSDYLLEAIAFPHPVISAAIEPHSLSGRKELIEVLSFLEKEDPTFVWREHDETGELIISGMGELHLDVTTTKITDDYGLAVRVGKPQVSYRETIRHAYRHGERYTQNIHGDAHTIALSCAVRPLEAEGEAVIEGDNVITIVEDDDAPLAAEIRDGIERGARGALAGGFALGYPAIHIEVEIQIEQMDTQQPILISEGAAARAVYSACKAANPVTLEPIMRVAVITPEENVGEVVNCLQQRGGATHSIDGYHGRKVVTGEAPMANLFGFSTLIRSATKGRAGLHIGFLKYAESGSSTQ